jgi:hypothetical protein
MSRQPLCRIGERAPPMAAAAAAASCAGTLRPSIAVRTLRHRLMAFQTNLLVRCARQAWPRFQLDEEHNDAGVVAIPNGHRGRFARALVFSPVWAAARQGGARGTGKGAEHGGRGAGGLWRLHETGTHEGRPAGRLVNLCGTLICGGGVGTRGPANGCAGTCALSHR